MREVVAADAEAHLRSLLDEVERGETLLITRQGRAIARLVPAGDPRRDASPSALADIERFRETMPSIPLEEILTGRHEGHKY